jgi:hypothetical protein
MGAPISVALPLGLRLIGMIVNSRLAARPRAQLVVLVDFLRRLLCSRTMPDHVGARSDQHRRLGRPVVPERAPGATPRPPRSHCRRRH